jgi:hypothetical protein
VGSRRRGGERRPWVPWVKEGAFLVFPGLGGTSAPGFRCGREVWEGPEGAWGVGGASRDIKPVRRAGKERREGGEGWSGGPVE